MISPVGGISVADGLVALARVGVANRLARSHELREALPLRGRRDSVEISPQHANVRTETATDKTERSFDQLSEAEQQQVRELETRDREVRTHEQAHKAAGGAHAGSISFSFATGPDGRRYATGGEVPIDVSPVQGDPHATIAKMQQVRQAAMAPAQPSAADRQVAARAAQIEREARAELNENRDTTYGAGDQETDDELSAIEVIVEQSRATGEPGPVLVDVLA